MRSILHRDVHLAILILVLQETLSVKIEHTADHYRRRQDLLEGGG